MAHNSFWQSKTSWLAISATLCLGLLCLNGRRLPAAEELQIVVMAWAAAFVRDTVAKKLDANTQAVTETTAATEATTQAVEAQTVEITAPVVGTSPPVGGGR